MSRGDELSMDPSWKGVRKADRVYPFTAGATVADASSLLFPAAVMILSIPVIQPPARPILEVLV